MPVKQPGLTAAFNESWGAVSKQFGEGLDGSGAHQRDLGKDSVKCAGLQRIVQGNSDGVGGRSSVPKPDMAPPLADYLVSEMFQSSDQTVGGNAAR